MSGPYDEKEKDPVKFEINVAAALCVAGAIYLASIGKDGWGWLLFVAVLLA